MNIINSYPVFESGQLLTSSQLNDTRSYLDENLRVNRTLLNGVGVVSGLEVTYSPDDNGQITISKGIGITTDGYLISVPELLTFNAFQDYSESPGDPFMPVYSKWYHPVSNIPFDIKELKATSGEMINDLPALESHVVMLFLKEIIDEQSTFCVSTDTDSSGSIRRYELVPLLMKETDFELLTAYDNEAQVKRNNPVWVFRIKRFVAASADPLTDYASPTPISETYETLINEHKGAVGDRIITAYQAYKAFLGLNYNETSQTFEEYIDAKLNSSTTLISDNVGMLQYVYAYLKDLNDACDEFAEAAYRSFKDTRPVNSITLDSGYKEPDFPRHLALGRVLPKTSMPGMIYKQKSRYYFTEQFRMEVKEEEILKAQLLFEKIVLMIKTFYIPSVGVSVPVLITPSMDEDTSLSGRALPYYYDLTAVSWGSRLYAIWNPDAYLKNQSKSQVFCGTVQTANGSVTNPVLGDLAPHIAAPLDYNINTNNFYRIEGHIGRTITDAEDQLKTLRKEKNLDFNIVLLELTTATPVDPMVENHNMELFHHFVDVNHGIEHKGGVEEGGTFILVHFSSTVVADFSLPSQSPYSSLLY